MTVQSETTPVGTPAPVAVVPAVVPQGQRFVDINAQPPVTPVAPDADVDEDDDTTPLPDQTPVIGAGGHKLEGQALRDRIDRERRKALREHFGTDDPAEIEKIKATRKSEAEELVKLKRVEDARRRSRMTAEQRTKETIESKDRRIQELEVALKNERQSYTIKEQNQIITSTAGRFISEESQDYALFMLRKHVKELSQDPKKLKGFSGKLEKSLEKWFTDFAAQFPQHALSKKPDAPAEITTPTVVKAPEPRRRPITTGSPPPNRKPAPTTTVVKQVKDMTKQELDSHYKSQGLKGVPY